jgi:D-ribose pyranase
MQVSTANDCQETIDISLVDDVPRVLDVVRAIRENFYIGRGVMAAEFRYANSPGTLLDFERALQGIHCTFEPREDFKRRVPRAIGLIRTGDTIRYSNLILESA